MDSIEKLLLLGEEEFIKKYEPKPTQAVSIEYQITKMSNKALAGLIEFFIDNFYLPANHISLTRFGESGDIEYNSESAWQVVNHLKRSRYYFGISIAPNQFFNGIFKEIGHILKKQNRKFAWESPSISIHDNTLAISFHTNKRIDKKTLVDDFYCTYSHTSISAAFKAIRKKSVLTIRTCKPNIWGIHY